MSYELGRGMYIARAVVVLMQGAARRAGGGTVTMISPLDAVIAIRYCCLLMFDIDIGIDMMRVLPCLQTIVRLPAEIHGLADGLFALLLHLYHRVLPLGRGSHSLSNYSRLPVGIVWHKATNIADPASVVHLHLRADLVISG